MFVISQCLGLGGNALINLKDTTGVGMIVVPFTWGLALTAGIYVSGGGMTIIYLIIIIQIVLYNINNVKNIVVLSPVAVSGGHLNPAGKSYQNA